MSGVQAELIQAIRKGEVQSVKALFARGLFFEPAALDFGSPTEDRERDPGDEPSMESPLGLAARLGHGEIVHLLVDRGADIQYSPDGHNVNAFHEACKGHDKGLVAYLLEKAPAVMQSQSDTQWTALHFAAGYGGHEVVEFLVRLLALFPSLI